MATGKRRWTTRYWSVVEVNPFVLVPITNVYDVDKDGKVLLDDFVATRLAVNPFFTLPLIAP